MNESWEDAKMLWKSGNGPVGYQWFLSWPPLPMGQVIRIGSRMMRVWASAQADGQGMAALIYELSDLSSGEKVRFSHEALAWLVREGIAELG